MILMLTIVFASNVSAAVITTYVMDKDDLDNYGVYAIAIDTKTTHWQDSKLTILCQAYF